MLILLTTENGFQFCREIPLGVQTEIFRDVKIPKKKKENKMAPDVSGHTYNLSIVKTKSEGSSWRPGLGEIVILREQMKEDIVHSYIRSPHSVVSRGLIWSPAQ